MSQKRIIYQGDGGVCAVLIPAEGTGLTVEQIAEKDVPNGKQYRIVDSNSIPQDRTYRNAWVVDLNESKVKYDMPRARELHKDILRRARAPLLAQADVDYMRADETGNAAEKLALAQLKQQLRDVTADPRIEQAQTVQALKQAWPAVLGQNPL